MFIQNVAWIDIQKGDHFDCGDRAILISIVDPAMIPPVPKHKFEEVHHFEFLDIDDSASGKAIFDFSMKAPHAAKIVAILQRALEERRNVVVHCVAGLCRSGAVAEVGVMMGFQDTGRFRMPNLWVKKLLTQQLGWSYEEQIERQPEPPVNETGIYF